MQGTTGRIWRGAAYALPIVLLSALVVTYLVSPAFYLSCVLEFTYREYQIVENLNFAFALVAFVLLAWVTGQLWRQPADDGPTLVHRRGGTILVSLVTLGTLFIAGEEVNWGQVFVHWGLPETDRGETVQTNFHNNVSLINAQGLGTIGLCVVFFVLPIAWALRDRTKLPQSWWIAVPDGPSIFCLAIAMGWRAFKRVYILVAGKSDEDRFYYEFVEQVNEHKELLIAAALFLYAIHRVARLREARFRSETVPIPSE